MKILLIVVVGGLFFIFIEIIYGCSHGMDILLIGDIGVSEEVVERVNRSGGMVGMMVYSSSGGKLYDGWKGSLRGEDIFETVCYVEFAVVLFCFGWLLGGVIVVGVIINLFFFIGCVVVASW
jgi:hypothetical protein